MSDEQIEQLEELEQQQEEHEIAIITPTYNCADYLLDLHKSITQQTEDWVWIVVDDGSTDDISDVMKYICGKDNRVKYTRREENLGANSARNIALGIAAAYSPKCVFFADADSLLYQTSLGVLKLALWNSEADFAYSGFDWGGIRSGSCDSQPWNLETLRRVPYISSMSLFWWESLQKYLPLDESLTSLQDYDLFLAIGESGGFGFYLPLRLFLNIARKDGIAYGQTRAKWEENFAYIHRKYGRQIQNMELVLPVENQGG